jgi:hypothetical protein
MIRVSVEAQGEVRTMMQNGLVEVLKAQRTLTSMKKLGLEEALEELGTSPSAQCCAAVLGEGCSKGCSTGGYADLFRKRALKNCRRP